MTEKNIYQNRIRDKLMAELQPTYLEIIDESARHHGHAGAHAEGETHFSITIVSSIFEGQKSVDRQRYVYKILEFEIKERVHALQLTTKTPTEHNNKL